jgi:hypothetical protein
VLARSLGSMASKRRECAEIGACPARRIIRSGSSKSRPPASNHAAIRELRRIDAQLARMGQQGLGDSTGRGRLDEIVHGRDREL